MNKISNSVKDTEALKQNKVKKDSIRYETAVRKMKSKLRTAFVIEVESLLDKINKREKLTSAELRFIIYFKEHFDEIIYEGEDLDNPDRTSV